MDFVVDQIGMNNLLNSMKNQKEQEEFADQYAERNCGNGWSGWICKAFTTSSAQEQSKIAYMQEIHELDQEFKDRKSLQKKSLEDAEKKLEACLEKNPNNDNACQTQKQAVKSLEENNYLEDKYNKDLSLLFNKEIENSLPNIEDECKDSFSDVCKKAIQDYDCKDDNKCETNKDKALNMLDENEKNQFIETGFMYEVFSFLNDDFESGKKVARAFNIQPNYENVPEWLKESTASQICMAKIGGYLEDEKNANPGTSYGSCVQDNKNPDKPQNDPECTEVKADIRATKSKITPDNKIWISYSALLKTPTSGKISTAVMLSYTQGTNNKKQKEIIKFLNITNSEGKYWQDYDNYELEINTTYGKVNDDILIWIISLNQDKSKYITVKDTVHNSVSKEYDGIEFGNSQGNKNAKENEEETPINEDYMIDTLEDYLD